MPRGKMGQERGLGNWGWEWLTAGATSLALQPGSSIPSPFRRAGKEREVVMPLVPSWAGPCSCQAAFPTILSFLVPAVTYFPPPQAWE